MPLDLADYERKAREAVKVFWGNRAAAVQKQRELGRADQGERAGVTAGKNMDGFITLIQDVIRANGLGDADMMIGRRLLTLPGFFRPTKLWDLLVINRGRLVAALELKSQIGPSFGNNFNNRPRRRLAPRLISGPRIGKAPSERKRHALSSAGLCWLRTHRSLVHRSGTARRTSRRSRNSPARPISNVTTSCAASWHMNASIQRPRCWPCRVLRPIPAILPICLS